MNQTMTVDQVTIAKARSAMYRLLAAAFLYPNLPTAKAMESGEWMMALRESAAVLDEPHREAVTAMLQALEEAMDGFNLDLWQSSYVSVFGHTFPKDYPPYETQYGSAHIFMQANELADIAAFYRAWGLTVREGIERLDHIAVELEFMGFLCEKEAYALTQGHAVENLAIVRDAQRRFLKDHLGRWLPAFCRLLKRKSVNPFYRALAEVTLTFVQTDMEALGVQTKAWTEADLRPLPDDEEPGCFSCPMATEI